MKRFVFALIGGLLFTTLAFAQSIDEGYPAPNMFLEGLTAAHDTYPIGSKIKIINTETNREIEVTIVSEITPAPTRIIEVSPDVWDELELYRDTIVRLVYFASLSANSDTYEFDDYADDSDDSGPYVEEFHFHDGFDADFDTDIAEYNDFSVDVEDEIAESVFDDDFEIDVIDDKVTTAVESPPAAPPPPQAPPPVVPTPPQSPSAQVPVISESAPASKLYHLLVLDRAYCAADADIGVSNNINVLYKFKHGSDGYLIALYASAGGTAYPPLPDKSRILINMVTVLEANIRDYINSGAFQRLVMNPAIISDLQGVLVNNLPVNMPGLKIIPAALPDPNSEKIYRLQIGAFSVPESADRSVQQLKDAGFEAAQEKYGSLYRVLAVGVRAAQINSAVQRLYAAGFKEIWIRE